jgi:predicted DNA-binding transcriptional regulator YafY
VSEKKSRILYIKRFMEEYSDDFHPVTVTDILAHLTTEGIEASRPTVARELNNLSEVGIDVVCNDGKPKQFFIGERYFEMPELKMLVDAIRASRFIPPHKVDALIIKLSGFVSSHQSEELRRSLYTDKQARPVGDKAYITVDRLYTAERTGKKIECKYFDWNAKKEKVYRHGNKIYSFSPYGMVWNNDRYYTVGWSDSHNKVITLRVDRIADPKLTKRHAVPKPEGFDMAFYAESVIQMYDGAVRDVTLRCENDMMKHVIDIFGEDVKTEITDEEHFTAYVRTPASPTFFSRICTFGGAIRITAPEDVLRSYREMLKAAMR